MITFENEFFLWFVTPSPVLEGRRDFTDFCKILFAIIGENSLQIDYIMSDGHWTTDSKYGCR